MAMVGGAPPLLSAAPPANLRATPRRANAGSILLCCVLLSLLLEPVPIRVGGRLPNLFVADLLITLAAAYAFALRRPMQMRDRRVRSAVAWMGLYCVVIVATLPMAVDILRSIAYVKLYVMPLLVFLTALRLYRSPSDLNRVLLTCSIVGIGLSIGALFNWTGYYSGALQLSSEFGAKDMVQMAGARSNTVAGIGAALLPGALFATWQRKMHWRVLGIAGLVGLCATITFSMSRGAVVSGILGVGLPLTRRLWSRSTTQWWKAIVAIIALVTFGFLSWLLLPSALQQIFRAQTEQVRLDVTETPEANDRLVRWRTLIVEGVKNPLGIGVGNYEYVSTLEGPKMGGSAHNLYLETMNEAGWVAVVALVMCLVQVWRAIRRLRDLATSEQFAGTAVTMAFLVFAVNVAVEPNYFSVPFSYLFWITMGTALAAGGHGGRRARLAWSPPVSPRGGLFRPLLDSRPSWAHER